MIIHRGHTEGLSSYMLKQFEDRLFEHVKKVFPERTAKLGDQETRAQVQRGIGRAQRHYVTRENDVARYVDLQFLVGEDFEQRPQMAWANDILTNHKLAGDAKMRQIYDQLPDKLRGIYHAEKAGGGR